MASPIGRALIGRLPGDVIEVTVPVSEVRERAGVGPPYDRLR